ncbi:HpcH/HpaI aldolase/citrate lyase family protein [Roseomonas elaeocarpi]|uniref:HpcH/HpaI aldolase/citrate lyase family protein n=1 Tax=Roseomonas elaeocarpi TaxID=907779 RepID=A0ABV6JMK8_9PROT
MLYVPANVARFVNKAAATGADAVILDLEDSVPLANKAEARDALAGAVATCRAGADRMAVLARVNRPLRLAVPDLVAAVAAGVDGVLLTKVHGPEHVALVAELLDELEAERPPGTPRRAPTALVPVVETPRAALRLEAIAAASPRIVGMLVGAEDLAAECGSTADDPLMVGVKRQMVLAAAAAGIAPLGTLGSVADFRDPEAVRSVAEQARRSGFTGASCIHPALVPVLNAAFSPGEAELALARRQLAAAEEAAREGRGSFTVDGRMVDEPILRRARRLVAAAEGSV